MKINKFWFGIIMIFILGGVFTTAKIVQYLSNRAVVDVSVSSPIEINVADGTFNVHGGETFVISMGVDNHANTALTGNMTTTINNPDGLTCDDFTAISVLKSINDTTNTTYNPSCTVIDEDNVQLGLYPIPYTWLAGQNELLLIEITMNVAAVGDYVLTTQVLL